MSSRSFAFELPKIDVISFLVQVPLLWQEKLQVEAIALQDVAVDFELQDVNSNRIRPYNKFNCSSDLSQFAHLCYRLNLFLFFQTSNFSRQTETHNIKQPLMSPLPPIRKLYPLYLVFSTQCSRISSYQP